MCKATRAFLFFFCIVIFLTAAPPAVFALSAPSGYVVIRGVSVNSREYNGTINATVKAFTFEDAPPSGADVQVEYTASFESEKAGLNKVVTVRTTGLSGADAHRFALVGGSEFTTSADITPYRGAVCTVEPLEIKAGASGYGQLPLAERLHFEGPGDAGTVEIRSATVTDGDILKEVSLLDNTLLYQTISPLQADQSGEITLEIVSENYGEMTAHLDIIAVAADPLTVSGVSINDKTYNGRPALPIGEPTVLLEGKQVLLENADWWYTGREGTLYESSLPPVDAGAYRVVISVPATETRFTGESDPIDFVIHPARLAVKPHDVHASVGDSPPLFDAFDYEGFADGDTESVLNPPPKAEAVNADYSRPGTAEIQVVNDPKAPNYAVELGTGILTILEREEAKPEAAISAPQPNAAGWYREAITITADTARYEGVALSASGPFLPALLLASEGNSAVTLYLRDLNGGISEYPFPLQLDRTPPTIGEVAYIAEESILTVDSGDALSGIASLTVTGPEGGAIVGTGGRFAATLSGAYHIEAADRAGNIARRFYTVSKVDSGNDDGTFPQEEPTGNGEGNQLPGDTTGNSEDEQLPGDTPAVTDNPSRSRSTSGGSSVRDGDGPFWSIVADRIRRAGSGGAVRVMLSSHSGAIPGSVLEAMSHSGVYLRIIRSVGEPILLAPEDVPPLTADGYSVEELAAWAANSGKEEEILPDMQSPDEPETGGVERSAPAPATEPEPKPEHAAVSESVPSSSSQPALTAPPPPSDAIAAQTVGAQIVTEPPPEQKSPGMFPLLAGIALSLSALAALTLVIRTALQEN